MKNFYNFYNFYKDYKNYKYQNLQNYQTLQIFSTRNLKKFLGNLVEILFCVFLFIYVYLKNGLNCFSSAIVVISP